MDTDQQTQIEDPQQRPVDAGGDFIGVPPNISEKERAAVRAAQLAREERRRGW